MIPSPTWGRLDAPQRSLTVLTNFRKNSRWEFRVYFKSNVNITGVKTKGPQNIYPNISR